MSNTKVWAYTVVVHEGDAKADGYWAEVEELPGCLGSGLTLDDLERDVRDAIESYVLDLRADGRPVPEGRVVDEPSLRRWQIAVPDPALVD